MLHLAWLAISEESLFHTENDLFNDRQAFLNAFVVHEVSYCFLIPEMRTRPGRMGNVANTIRQ